MLLQSAGLTYGFIRGDILPQDLDQGTVPAPVISRQVVVYSCIHTIIRERERGRVSFRLCSEVRKCISTRYLHKLARHESGQDENSLLINRGNEYSNIECKFRERNSEFEKFRCNINKSLVVNE